MHIALIRQYFDSSHGGAERYAVSLAHALISRGHRVTAVCSRANPDDIHDIEVANVSRCKWAGFMRHAAFAWRAGAAARSLGADQVIALARAWPADVMRLGDPPHWAWLRVTSGGPTEARRAMHNPRHRALLGLEEKLLTPGQIGEYVANSEMVKRQVVHAYGVMPERVHVLRNPVDGARFNPNVQTQGDALRAELGIAPDEMVLLFAAMEFRRKGLVQAARTFVALVNGAPALRTKMRLLVAGRDDATPGRAVLEAAGCADRMIVLPASTPMERCYGAANIFLLPTLYDPAANAVGEALACGTPVVTTASNGASELIKNGANGFVVADRDDAQACAAAVTQLLATERVQRSRQYVAMVHPSPSWEEHAVFWEEILTRRERDKLEKKLIVAAPHAFARRRSVDAEGALLVENSSAQAQSLIKRCGVVFDASVYEPRPDKVLKDHRGSVVARFPVQGASKPKDGIFAPSTPANAYLKVSREDPSAGPHEFDICQWCAVNGIDVMLPLAAGSDGRRSFCLSAEAPGEQLDVFIRKYCAGENYQHRVMRARVLEAVAKTTAKLHDAGVNHRDYYANHIRVALDIRGDVLITLIDLSRAQRRDAVPLRWAVKDLGALAFSLPKTLLSCTDRLRFLRSYCWHRGLETPRRKLVKMISARVAFIASRHAKVLAARERSDAVLPRQPKEHDLVPATRADLDL
ncbi:MAG: glycosyltransferase [Planctomycetes bacterium]|nr:glycosyltransferase [Planctomycetota bacterium]NUQ33511.1 glycosyltransferase [Planctomycetaceae bacterium]